MLYNIKETNNTNIISCVGKKVNTISCDSTKKLIKTSFFYILYDNITCVFIFFLFLINFYIII